MHTSNRCFFRYPVIMVLLAITIGFGILAAPSMSQAQNWISAKTGVGILFATSNPAAGLAATLPGPSPQRKKKVELPDGDGKAIVENSCQSCHELANVTNASKTLDDWRDTVQLMRDSGGDVPKDQVDTLVQYLAKNFGPKTPTPSAGAQTSPDPSAPSTDAKPGVSSQVKKVELPDGDGKAIATASCQICHKLTNLTDAHKSLKEWRQTVELMMDRGADIPPDKLDTLVQYLAKNFGLKEGAPGSGEPAGAAPSDPPSKSQ